MSNEANILLLNCKRLGHPNSLEQVLDAVQVMGLDLRYLRVGSFMEGLDALWLADKDPARRELDVALGIAYAKANLAFLAGDRKSHLHPWFYLEWENTQSAKPRQTRVNVQQLHTVLFTRKEFDREYYAQRFLEVGKGLYRIVRPRFGWVERCWHTGYTKAKHLEELAVPHIYWANFFGPEYVGKLGEEYLLNAPGWKKEELDDGGLLYVLSPHLGGTGPKAVVEQVKQYFGVDSVRRRRKQQRRSNR